MMLANVGAYLCRLGIVFWLGEMLFFISIFAPRVFKVLPREMAGQLQGHIFPAYYAAGLIAALVMSAGMLLRYLGKDASLPSGSRALCLWGLWTVAAIVFAYSLWVLTPQIDALRQQMYASAPSAELSEQFSVLHKWSVKVNSLALFALLALLAFI